MMGKRSGINGMAVWLHPEMYCQHKVKHISDQGTVYWVQCTNSAVKGKQMCRQHRRKPQQLELVLGL